MRLRVVKRAIDLAAAAVLATLCGPLMLCVAAMVYVAMGRPVLFRQQRAGYRGKPFTLLKFRTMREASGADGRALPDGERLSWLGRLLRRTSLDELPQLFNVLAGTMSLVGPRPLLVRYLDRYTPDQARRHDVKPGLTGWAQVHGRNALGWEEKFRLDLWYVHNASLLVDAWILVCTAWKVVRPEGVNHSEGDTMPEFMGSQVERVSSRLAPRDEASSRGARRLLDRRAHVRPAPSEVNVLFTSVGRRVELLRTFRKAYQELRLPGRIVAVDVDPLATALRLADRPYLVPRLDSPEYVAALCEILCRERVAIVFPLIDPDISVLAEHREVLESTGARLAVVSAKAAARCADKWRTHQFFERLGLPGPSSWLPGQLDVDRAEYPLFVKPRFGSASQHTFKVTDRRQLTFFCDYVPEPIVQEYLPGPEITSDVICDLEGNVLSVVSRQRIRVRSGEVLVGKTVHDPAITDACVRIAEALPAIGPITVQCMMSGRVPAFTEINARLGGGVPLATAAGVNWPEWLLAKLAAVPVEIPPLGSYRSGLYVSRCDESFFVTEAEREAMASCRL